MPIFKFHRRPPSIAKALPELSSQLLMLKSSRQRSSKVPNGSPPSSNDSLPLWKEWLEATQLMTTLAGENPPLALANVRTIIGLLRNSLGYELDPDSWPSLFGHRRVRR
jgi:hypothetical protein